MLREALHEVLITPESISFENIKKKMTKHDISAIPSPKRS
jgi:hypothetical protein